MKVQAFAIRAAVVLAVGLPWFLVLVPRTPTRKEWHEDPRFEADLNLVYAKLPEQYSFESFHEWCRLDVTTATDSDLVSLAHKLQSPEKSWLNWIWDQSDRELFIGLVRKPNNFKWYRIHDPIDQERWIGIGIWEAYRSGDPPLPLIAFRVPMGFEPSAADHSPKGDRARE